ncbi:MAG: hypothetical protein Q6J44_04835 [Gloeomargarita sp. DG02_4_bins_56]
MPGGIAQIKSHGYISFAAEERAGAKAAQEGQKKKSQGQFPAATQGNR